MSYMIGVHPVQYGASCGAAAPRAPDQYRPPDIARVLTHVSRRRGLAWHATEQPSNVPPGDMGLPIIGETLAVAANGDAFGPTRVARHGTVYKTNILNTPTVMVHEGNAVNALLTEQGAEVVWPATTAALVGPHSLNLLTGADHERVKRHLSVAVGPAALQHYIAQIQHGVTAAADEWVAAGAGGVELLPACKLLAFATFSGCVLGLAQDPATLQRNVDAMVCSTNMFTPKPIEMMQLFYH